MIDTFIIYFTKKKKLSVGCIGPNPRKQSLKGLVEGCLGLKQKGPKSSLSPLNAIGKLGGKVKEKEKGEKKQREVIDVMEGRIICNVKLLTCAWTVI